MKAIDVVARLQEKLIQMQLEIEINLEALNEQAKRDFADIKDAKDCNKDYLDEIAKHAWGQRGQKIAIMEINSLLKQITKEL